MIISQVYESLVVVERNATILVGELKVLVVQEILLANLLLLFYEANLIVTEMILPLNALGLVVEIDFLLLSSPCLRLGLSNSSIRLDDPIKEILQV